MGNSKNSVGNITYRRRSGVNIAQEKRIPSRKPPTPGQLNARNSMSIMYSVWKELSGILSPFFEQPPKRMSIKNKFIQLNIHLAEQFEFNPDTHNYILPAGAYVSWGHYPANSLDIQGSSQYMEQEPLIHYPQTYLSWNSGDVIESTTEVNHVNQYIIDINSQYRVSGTNSSTGTALLGFMTEGGGYISRQYRGTGSVTTFDNIPIEMPDNTGQLRVMGRFGIQEAKLYKRSNPKIGIRNAMLRKDIQTGDQFIQLSINPESGNIDTSVRVLTEMDITALKSGLSIPMYYIGSRIAVIYHSPKRRKFSTSVLLNI